MGRGRGRGGGLGGFRKVRGVIGGGQEGEEEEHGGWGPGWRSGSGFEEQE